MCFLLFYPTPEATRAARPALEMAVVSVLISEQRKIVT
jgi:hypothetical protein